ncbi:MAG: hypothetical protein EOL97_06975 [Spirochaetia bacterium]|nr:hypothetical protein [Spirochaetia bacterium]
MKIYPNQFYSRSIFPDLVMKHKVTGKVIVFDAKFKNMNFSNNDLDRMDLHQIHSYSAYYNSNLLACGLLYPLNKDINTGKSYSTSLFGNSKNNIHFIIDGIEIPHQDDMEKLIKNEKSFINRLKTEINKMLKI